jgi:transglutaminase-like putative cysteine protease
VVYTKQSMKALVLYVFAFWLLWEWLIPLETVSDTRNIEGFVVFVALCFLLYFLRTPFWLGAFLKIGYIVYALHLLFSQSILSLLYEIVHHIPIIIRFRWTEMTNPFRSFLFFLLLWMMTYLVRYWLFVQKRLFLFYVMTVTYVAVLDTFTVFHGNGAIVRLVGFGFFLLSWLHYEKLHGKENGAMQNLRWLWTCISVICLSLFVGYIGPKFGAQWPDPVAFVKSYAQGTGEEKSNSSIKKIGYGNNDSQLGGPFIADNTVVFTAEDRQRHYWRVETKDIYTGKGWEVTDHVQVKTFEKENTVHQWFEDNVKKETFTAKVSTSQQYSYLIYPEGLKAVHVPQDVVFRLQASNEKIYPTDRESYIVPLQEYELTYEYPTFSVDQLNAAPVVKDEQLLKQYTQLPSNLPKRVRELAQRITQGKTTQYEKTKAIEQYFSLNDYFYETKDVAVPGKNDDYVDQFLFKTKKGYCDNFSTAMVVLLRSVGIPARWVKGYTSGEFVDKTKDEKNVYAITNNNAHSWVEVYFSGIGWVPFEPTQGFSNPYRFMEPKSQTVPTPTPQQTQPEQKRTPLKDVLKQENTPSPSVKDKLTSFFAFLSLKEITMVMLVLLGIALLLYKTRRKWWPSITLLSFKYKRGDYVFIKAYLSLLNHLDDYGLKRKKEQTLRQYASYVDEWFGTNEMSQLTLLYEKAVYQNEAVNIEWEKMKELWENLIKKTAS